MRYNDEDINLICNKVKNKFPFLRVANSDICTYDGTEFDNPLITVPIVSVSVTGNVIELDFRISTLDINDESFDMLGLASTSTGNAVLSCEYTSEFEKDDLTQWKIIYKINLLR